ncbi:uncharacterized protein PWA37_004312 [Arxiozyma heterogenica]|uniref:uncharacterized protein n=1 Tax=Arxiozyma heterogenica TaxID=278026 RepID=UPI002F008982
MANNKHSDGNKAIEAVELSNESEILVDRKSKFQARCCSLTDQNSIASLLHSLLDNNKLVAKASHKYMYAWRIGVLKQNNTTIGNRNNNNNNNNNKLSKKKNKAKSNNNDANDGSNKNNSTKLDSTNYTNIQQGCFDGGEAGAGQRLLTLLERSNAINVLVIVTRWYGGTPLGPARFRHICSTAAESLKKR